jgi:hypothetical protein
VKKENRGGARKGSGAKPISKKYSDALKRDVHSALARKAKETGLTFGDVLVNVVYEDSPSNAPIRAGAFKIIQEILLIRETQSTSDVNVSKTEGLVIGLPPIEKPVIPVKQKPEKDGAALH